MQLEVISVILRSIRIVKDVMVQSLYQWYTFDRGEEIFRHHIAELVVRNVLDIIGCDVGNLPESIIPCQRLIFTVKRGFILIIGSLVSFMGSAVLIGHISCGILFFRFNHKLKAGLFGESFHNLLPDIFHISEILCNIISNGFRNLIRLDIERAIVF